MVTTGSGGGHSLNFQHFLACGCVIPVSGSMLFSVLSPFDAGRRLLCTCCACMRASVYIPVLMHAHSGEQKAEVSHPPGQGGELDEFNKQALGPARLPAPGKTLGTHPTSASDCTCTRVYLHTHANMNGHMHAHCTHMLKKLPLAQPYMDNCVWT